MIKISVVIPMFNSKDTIKSALESVLSQTYPDFLEVVVINDGSNDGCDKIVNELILKNTTNRIIKLINKSNGGVSSARNRGIREASGDWIALLDSDDIWLPEKLKKQVEEIERNSMIKFIGTNRNGERYKFSKKSDSPIYILNVKDVLAQWYPQTSTALISKEILLKTNLYDESRTHSEDGDLWLRILLYCDLYVLNSDLVYTGDGKRGFGESGLSANIKKMYKGELLALKGAKNRKQINFFKYLSFYLWLTLKYYRRIAIVRIVK